MENKFYLNDLLDGAFFDTAALVDFEKDEKGFYTTDEKHAEWFKRYANGYKIADELGMELEDYEDYAELSDTENRDELDETDKRILSLVSYFLIDNDIEILDDEGYEYIEAAAIERNNSDIRLHELYIELENIVNEKIFNPYIHEYIDYFYVKDNKLCVAIRLHSEEKFNDHISLQ